MVVSSISAGISVPAGTVINSITGNTAVLSNVVTGSTGSASFEAVGPSDTAANGGGLILKGTVDKSILYDNSRADKYWVFTENLEIAPGKKFVIGNQLVLDTTTLGPTVVSSSLTTVGTLSGLTVSGNATFDTNTLFVNAANDRVGIGTTNPGEKLHVVGGILCSLDSGSGSIQIGNAVNTQYHYINFGGAVGALHDAWQLGRSPSGGVGPTNGFYLYDLKNSATRLAVDTSGNVGIGTINPEYKLDVQGGQNVTTQISLWGKTIGQPQTLIEPGKIYATAAGQGPGNLLINPTGGNVGIGTDNPGAKLHLSVATAGSNGTKGIRITNPAGTIAMLECGANNDSYVGTESASDFSIRTQNSPRITILGSSGAALGNVGIGTTNPTTKLDVNGSIKASQYGTLGNFSAQLGQIRVGGDEYGNVIRVVSDTNMNIIANNNIYFNSGAALDGSNYGSNVAYFGTNGLYLPSGKGIDFSAAGNASGMTSELLNDYETGTWTPTVNGWTGVTYSIQQGVYTKVGNLVTAWFYLQFSGTNGASNVSITGLPFNVNNSGSYARGGAPTYYNVPLNETTGVLFYPSSTSIDLYTDSDSGNSVQSNGDAGSAGGQYIIGSVHYIA